MPAGSASASEEQEDIITLHGYGTARALLSDPLTNKGTAFTQEERDHFGLHGLLPPHVGTLEAQIERRRRALDALPDDFHRYIFLRELQDANEILFQALVQSDLPHMLPLVYTPTVGEGCQRFSEIWRKVRGLFISWPNRDRIEHMLANPAFDRVKVIVVSDGERILGLGDQGAGGMGIPIGKLALYTACAGIHPGEVLPILLDAGTDNAALRDDPLYVGWRHARVRGDDYDHFVDQFVDAVARRWPHVVLQWEDFAGANAWKLLDRHRARLPSFNDDIQGTAATAVGTLMAAVRRVDRPLQDQRIVMFGFGAAGAGIADLLVQAMVEDGASPEQARAAIWPVDRMGLVMEGQGGLSPAQRRYARRPQDIAGWGCESDAAPSLAAVVRHVGAGVLVGTSGQPGAFSEEVIRAMASACDRPVVFPLSNPVSHCEAHPADVLAWSEGRAIIGTGSPFAVEGITQVNNVYVFPGIGLGVLAARASRVSDAMFLAAARTIAGMNGNGPLLPPVERLRDVALEVACAVSQCAGGPGRAEIAAMMWEAQYPGACASR
ncbi:malate dehydrogenase (oxaloacetate-decarboxylating) [Novosphingobium sp. SG751A]|uniref:NAD-dependent malic enzyme n=1 Tax=Novosphingobium sp. SG751A TaxID=2587000 RepID=UPI0020A6A716|nr:NAD-dependent malic enzyme [Novosphingobium sp. SG751A]NOW44014.1 malate dehydrogenase (oxaloacetate-decarboxylating) [Novosphingobium sp. SG751A]